MGRLFGTDGVRGLANRDVTAELALGLSVAAARVLSAQGAFVGHRPRAVVGRDSRASGELLGAAVAYLTATLGVDLGVVLSASHNAMPDNGIKFLARGGLKLDDDLEIEIEELLGQQWEHPVGADVGRIRLDTGGAGDSYVEHLVSTIDVDLAGLRIAVDCANGAASHVGPAALRASGADVVVINASPDGRNINEKCGSTNPEQLQAAVVASRADLGVAFDGDADRCLAVDRSGRLVDGDQIMGVLAIAMRERGALVDDTLVATIMSNLGLRLAMKAEGIRTLVTGVGDRYVLEAMRAGGYSLGGEQSGHVILADYATTGDGVLTALQLSARVVGTGRTLEQLASVVQRLPQTLVNVAGVDRARADVDEALADAVRTAETELGQTGRVLLRPSGTEALVRVMVEAASQLDADRIAARLADVVRERLAL